MTTLYDIPYEYLEKVKLYKRMKKDMSTHRDFEDMYDEYGEIMFLDHEPEYRYGKDRLHEPRIFRIPQRPEVLSLPSRFAAMSTDFALT